jgi:hypothetical protein
MTATTTPLQRAEQSGGFTASVMNNAVLNSANQAQALAAIIAALNECFNPDDDAVTAAVAGGFAVRIVNVMERGFQAIRADGEKS